MNSFLKQYISTRFSFASNFSLHHHHHTSQKLFTSTTRLFSTKAELFTHPSKPHRPHLFTTIYDFQKFRKTLPLGSTVGFVPTMGALHAGHIQLVKESKLENEYTFVSIFVNPTQFLPHEDLSKYPRQLEADMELLSKEQGVIGVFAPTPNEMYPPDRPHRVYVSFPFSDRSLEGSIRPGHFQGVLTVVNKLFNIVRPTSSYFGQKDGMQCIVLKNMIDGLNIPVKIKIVKTMREKDGLAMSSRNVYLTQEERGKAKILYESLINAQRLFLSSASERNNLTVTQVKNAVKHVLVKEPLVSIQYVGVASNIDGAEVDEEEKVDGEKEYMLSIAVKLGNVRLIDNCILSKDKSKHI